MEDILAAWRSCVDLGTKQDKNLILQETPAFRKGRIYDIRRYLQAIVTTVSPTAIPGGKAV